MAADDVDRLLSAACDNDVAFVRKLVMGGVPVTSANQVGMQALHVAAMYGSDTTKWVGQRITIYPTTTQVGRDTVDCIRVRAMIPKGKAEPSAPTQPAPAEDNIPDEEK